MKHARGITALETLVTAATVALLVVTLVPALGNARSAMRQAACASNLRKIGTMNALYEMDNDGRLPPTGFSAEGGSWDPGWPGLDADDTVNGIPARYGDLWTQPALLLAYGELDDFIDPAQATDFRATYGPDDLDFALWWLNYGLNGYLHGSATGGPKSVVPNRVSKPGTTATRFCAASYYQGGGSNNALNSAGDAFRYLPGFFTKEWEDAEIHPVIEANPLFLADATTPRHAGPAINALFFDGTVNRREVFDLWTADADIVNGLWYYGRDGARLDDDFWGVADRGRVLEDGT